MTVHCVPLPICGAQGAGCVATSLGPDAAEPTNSSTALAAPQQAVMPWQREGNRVIIRHWLDGSSFNKEAAAVSAAAEAVGKADPEAPEGISQVEQPLLAAEQQPDLPDKAQPSPAGQGECLAGHSACLQKGPGTPCLQGPSC